MILIPLEKVPLWARYLAQDPDGSWWAYEGEPHIHDNGWYENELGRLKKLDLGSEQCVPSLNWRETLRRSGLRST